MDNPKRVDIGATGRSLQKLTDKALLDRLDTLLQREHAMEVELLLHIGEVDRRRLYRERGFSSMFHYCVHELHLAESVAYRRIRVARAAREFPILLAKIQNRELHLRGACLLASHLTSENIVPCVATCTNATAVNAPL